MDRRYWNRFEGITLGEWALHFGVVPTIEYDEWLCSRIEPIEDEI